MRYGWFGDNSPLDNRWLCGLNYAPGPVPMGTKTTAVRFKRKTGNGNVCRDSWYRTHSAFPVVHFHRPLENLFPFLWVVFYPK